MGFSKIWVHGEANDGVVASITLELLAKARELAETVEVVVAGDADSVAAELENQGYSTFSEVEPGEGFWVRISQSNVPESMAFSQPPAF